MFRSVFRKIGFTSIFDWFLIVLEIRIQGFGCLIFGFSSFSIFVTTPTQNGRFCISSTLLFPLKMHAFTRWFTEFDELPQEIKFWSENDHQNGEVELTTQLLRAHFGRWFYVAGTSLEYFTSCWPQFLQFRRFSGHFCLELHRFAGFFDCIFGSTIVWQGYYAHAHPDF